MPSKVPEHAVVALLKQCYVNPRCRAISNCGTLQTSISARSYHICNSRPRHRKQSSFRAQNRFSRIHTTSQKCSQAISGSSFSISELPHPPLFTKLATHQNDGNNRSSDKSSSIAILGGGITGLAAAHYVARELPHVNITIYEASNRLGGWLQSEQVDVGNGQKIIFEYGPRTLRPHTPASLATMELIQDLGLKHEVVINPKGSIAASNRFIYYPDHLVRMPGPGQDLFANLWTIVSESVFKGFWKAVGEHSRPRRPSTLEDESISSFLARRLGTPHIGDNIASAVLHGIYAGDINKLSARSIFGGLWAMEAAEGSLMTATFNNTVQGKSLYLSEDANLILEMSKKMDGELKNMFGGASVYSFKGGISSLTNALENDLRSNPKVQFNVEDPVTSIDYENGVKIETKREQSKQTYDFCISTLSSKRLSSISVPPLPSLALTPFVTVMVVNLYYSDPDILPEHGFGYLIPRSIPFEQNPECALGVVFDSDAIGGQDTAPGTKVTVMLGGHWWDGFEAYPDEEEGAAMAKLVLARHLRITAEPEKVRVNLQKDCIPQYTVGHTKRMHNAHKELLEGYSGNLRVAGNSYTGVGLNDCVKAARQVVMNIKEEVGGLSLHRTGLEDMGKEKWVTLKTR